HVVAQRPNNSPWITVPAAYFYYEFTRVADESGNTVNQVTAAPNVNTLFGMSTMQYTINDAHVENLLPGAYNVRISTSLSGCNVFSASKSVTIPSLSGDSDNPEVSGAHIAPFFLGLQQYIVDRVYDPTTSITDVFMYIADKLAVHRQYSFSSPRIWTTAEGPVEHLAIAGEFSPLTDVTVEITAVDASGKSTTLTLEHQNP
ncbi:MAG: hypothetical protein V1798_04185, partial [Pseudomonadota bacterium]